MVVQDTKLINEIKAIVISRLSFEIPIEMDLDSYIDEVMQRVSNYINQDRIPHELKYTIARIIVDVMNYEYSLLYPVQSNPSSEELTYAGPITRIKDHNVEVQFSDQKLQTNEILRNKYISNHGGNLDSFLFNYINELNAFRKLTWW